MARWHSCNVLQAGADARQLWQFDARKADFALDRQHTANGSGPLPDNLVGKSWRSLWQPRLNVAWLPGESVFLRVVHLPQSSFEETLSMVEFQLEKLSPIPVTQAVWSVYALPAAPLRRDEPSGANPLQTLIVVLAERKAVEEFLGQLEGQGYLADRLELGVLDQLQATPINEDGAWIYPGASGGPNTALVAWWYGGVLQNLNYITLPVTEDRVAGLKEQLAHMVWAGEMEGWLTGPPAWHLVAEAAMAAEWETPLRQAVDGPLALTAPLDAGALAALTAKRAAHAEPKANLLPPDYSTRYRQQFVDRLWIRGLLAVGAVYLVGVMIYFAALSFQLYRVSRAETEVKNASQSYTNAIELKTRYGVLKERQDLKFAALDCWKTVAELIPQDLTLDSFNLVEGRRLSLNGTAPADGATQSLDFNSAMRKATIGGKPLADQEKGDQYRDWILPGGAGRGWSFVLELKRSEVK